MKINNNIKEMKNWIIIILIAQNKNLNLYMKKDTKIMGQFLLDNFKRLYQ